MELLNFNIGQVQYHEINGQSVPTAYIKTPQPEPWLIGPSGPIGNELAIHTDHLYAYSIEDRAFWEKHFNVESGRWLDGFFGENLTMDHLDPQDIRLGDVFTLGDEVQVIVTGPRTPCTKLTWRLGQPGTFLKEFLESGRVGIYFSVLQPGRVRPGDRLERIEKTEHPTVAQITRFFAGTENPSVEQLEYILALPFLSISVGHILNAQLKRAKDVPLKSVGKWKGWREFEIDEVRDEAAGIKSFLIRATDGEPLAKYHAGQFVSVNLEGHLSEPTVRQWSISDFSDDPQYYRLSIKREEDGFASKWMHSNVVPGMRLQVRSPSGQFRLDDSSFRPAALIAGGIGITPLLAMMHAQAARGANAPMIHFFFSVPRRELEPFREEIDAIFAANPSWRRHIFYTQEGVESPPIQGRLSAPKIIELLEGNHIIIDNRRVDFAWFETDFYICGPSGFQDAIFDGLCAAGAVPDRIYREAFQGSSLSDTETPIPMANVTYAKSGVTSQWLAADGESLLDHAAQHGVEIPSDCLSGICASCETKILEGAVIDGRGSPLGARQYARLCVGKPATSNVVLDA